MQVTIELVQFLVRKVSLFITAKSSFMEFFLKATYVATIKLRALIKMNRKTCAFMALHTQLCNREPSFHPSCTKEPQLSWIAQKAIILATEIEQYLITVVIYICLFPQPAIYGDYTYGLNCIVSSDYSKLKTENCV